MRIGSVYAAEAPGWRLTLTPGIAARLTSRLWREVGTPDGLFHASLSALEACNLPAPAAQAIYDPRQKILRCDAGGADR